MSADRDDILPPEMAAHARALEKWLISEARFIEDPNAIIEPFTRHLEEAGVPLDRITSAIPTLHALRQGLGRQWSREKGVETQVFPWDSRALYEASPFYRAHETREWVEFRLDEIDDAEYGIVAELREGGYTHYICVPIFFRDGAMGGITFATCRPEGFSAADIAFLRAIEPAIANVLEVNRTWRLLREILSTYVGDEPQARILSGQVRRGDVVHIRSAIVFADMRGFTALTGQMSGEETVALLNRYFDCVVPPIEAAGGDVLKYMGDGVLAIFRAEDQRHERFACERALSAARAIVRQVADDRVKADDATKFDIKIALHFGEVAYGNIGSGARLDYTVVGGSVNLASRLADLAGHLDRHILVSTDFVARLPDVDVEPRGVHELRGVAEPQSVFEPRE